MKSLNKQAKEIFLKLCNTMVDGPYAVCKGVYSKINNDDCFMPVSVERIQTLNGQDGISIAHFFIQNGDLMADPEMEFIVKNDEVYPVSFKLDSLGIFQVVMFDKEDNCKHEELQASLTVFANKWMLNIEMQQFSDIA